ncbi:hypothetical protein HGP28_03815 [Vibrio sp. SM6]|uniref:Uncharacterized protein n=1 Tax=Vibrio agarilyticus TaxID=2726741 RepID=A0A7X8TNJ2_9VIBR|nr:hypothetical protein [Vibrio agarilyticus]NLS12018.1 hypothetical protein [Vibrio agarilyticus]
MSNANRHCRTSRLPQFWCGAAVFAFVKGIRLSPMGVFTIGAMLCLSYLASTTHFSLVNGHHSQCESVGIASSEAPDFHDYFSRSVRQTSLFMLGALPSDERVTAEAHCSSSCSQKATLASAPAAPYFHRPQYAAIIYHSAKRIQGVFRTLFRPPKKVSR